MFDLIDRVIDNHLGRRKLVSPADVFQMTTEELSGFGQSEYKNTAELIRWYEKLSWVFRCVSFITTNLAKLPWEVHRKLANGKTELVENNPAFYVLTKPNKWQSLYEFKTESYSRLMLQGEMFWELQYAGSRIEAMFADWKSSEVQVVPDKEKFIRQFKRTINGKVYPFKPEEVFMQKFFNPNDNYRGLPPLSAGTSAANLDLDAIKFNQNFFKQGLKLGGIIQTKQSLEKKEADRVKNTFAEMYQGNDVMHKVGVLWSGFEFIPLNTMTQNDIQFAQLREMNRDEIIAVYGLSLEVLGMGEKTYENVKYYRRMAWTETLIPLMDKILSGLDNSLLPRLVRDPDRYIMKTSYKDIEALKEDRGQKVKDYSEGVKLKAITRNEMRVDCFGKDALDDPDMNDVNTNPGSPGGGVPAEPKSKSMIDVYQMPVKTYEDRTKVWHTVVKGYENKYQRDFKSAITIFFNYQKRVVTQRAREYGKSLKDFKEILQVEGVIYDRQFWEKKLEEDFNLIISSTVRHAGQDVMDAIEAGILDMTTPHVRAALGERVNRLSNFINDTTDRNIKKIITRTLQETAGQNISEVRKALAKELADWFDVITPSRIEKIARTEAVGAANLGTQVALTQQNILPNKIWITSRDDRVRDSHKIDGQVKKIDEDFELNDGSRMPYPMDIMERCVELGTTEPVTG